MNIDRAKEIATDKMWDERHEEGEMIPQGYKFNGDSWVMDCADYLIPEDRAKVIRLAELAHSAMEFVNPVNKAYYYARIGEIVVESLRDNRITPAALEDVK